MEYRTLGRSGLKVSTLTLGTMTFGGTGPFAGVGNSDLAEARRMIDMCIDAGDCVLTITDDGRGSPPPHGPRGKSFGLIGMRERARMLGGSVSVRTAEGEGFTLIVTLPLEGVQHEETQP